MMNQREKRGGTRANTFRWFSTLIGGIVFGSPTQDTQAKLRCTRLAEVRYKKCRDFKMKNHDEIRIEEIKSEENIGELNLLDGENIKIELPSHEEITTEIDQNQMILEGQGSKRAFCLTNIASESCTTRLVGNSQKSSPAT